MLVHALQKYLKNNEIRAYKSQKLLTNYVGRQMTEDLRPKTILSPTN